MTGTPTPTALAAKAFMARIDNETYQRIIETRAVLGGWAGSRGAGCYDTHLSDAITKAALGAVMDLFRAWAAEVDEAARERRAELEGMYGPDVADEIMREG